VAKTAWQQISQQEAAMSNTQQPTTEPVARSSPSMTALAPGATTDACSDARPMMDPQRRADVLLRRARRPGKCQGVSRMVSADRYCVDVLTQISAAQKALDGAARVITRNCLERCVTDAIAHGDPLIYDELMRVIDRRR